LYDLDVDPMILILGLDIDILTRIPNMKFIGQGFQKLEHIRTDRHIFAGGS